MLPEELSHLDVAGRTVTHHPRHNASSTRTAQHMHHSSVQTASNKHACTTSDARRYPPQFLRLPEDPSAPTAPSIRGQHGPPAPTTMPIRGQCGRQHPVRAPPTHGRCPFRHPRRPPPPGPTVLIVCSFSIRRGVQSVFFFTHAGVGKVVWESTSLGEHQSRLVLAGQVVWESTSLDNEQCLPQIVSYYLLRTRISYLIIYYELAFLF